jgi:Tol biopolymer transport system component
MLATVCRILTAALSASAVCITAVFAGQSAQARTSSVRVSASGSGHLAAIVDSDDYGKEGVTSIVQTDGDGSHRHRLVADIGPAGYPAYSPNGRQLAVISAAKKKGGLVLVDTASGHVTQLVAPIKGVGVDGVSWTSDGRFVVYSANGAPNGTPSKRFAIFRVPVSGGAPQRLTPFENALQPNGTPDGRIVYTIASLTSLAGPSQVWSMPADGHDATRLFSEPFGVLLPHVAPDGRQIAFMRAFDNNLTATAIDVVGLHGGTVRELTPHRKDLYSANPSWSPDGTRLAYLSSQAGRIEGKPTQQLLDAYTMTAQGTDVTRVIGFSGARIGLDDLTWGR